MPRLRFTPYRLGVAVALPLFVWVVITIIGPTGLGRIKQLESAIVAEEIKASAFQERNQLMAEQIALLKSDDSQVEMLARYHLGMIMPGEVFIQTPPAK